MSAAGRLLVVVLDETQCPDTHFQRAVAAELGGLGAVPEGMAVLREGLERVEAAVSLLTRGGGL